MAHFMHEDEQGKNENERDDITRQKAKDRHHIFRFNVALVKAASL
jgi:hypothetical protein